MLFLIKHVRHLSWKTYDYYPSLDPLFFLSSETRVTTTGFFFLLLVLESEFIISNANILVGKWIGIVKFN